MLEPGYSVRGISVRRRKPNPWFRRGTVYIREALDVLRAAGQPMTAREIAAAMLAAKDVEAAGPQGQQPGSKRPVVLQEPQGCGRGRGGRWDAGAVGNHCARWPINITCTPRLSRGVLVLACPAS
jgi:hypothetical protein